MRHAPPLPPDPSKTKNRKLGVFLMECLSTSELNSKHVNLVRAIQKGNTAVEIYGAGELKKVKNSIKINGLSGTYMADESQEKQTMILEIN